MTRINVGEKIENFTFNTGFRNDVHLYDELKGKTVLWVLRYIGCTVCRYDVHLIAERYDEIQKVGGQVFVVMQSDQEHIQNDLKNTNAVLPFEIISDPDQKIYNALSILPAESREELVGNDADKLKEKGARAREIFVHGDYEGNELQKPAIFIVGEDGTVEYAHYAETIVDMPDVDGVLVLLKG